MATVASASPVKLGQPATSPSILTTDTPTVSANATSDPEPASPMPHDESTQTNKPTASSSTHDTTVLDSDRPSTMEQHSDPPVRALMTSAQAQLPSATTSFEATAERARLYRRQHSC